MSSRRRFGRLRRLPSGRWQARYPDREGQLISAPNTFATKTDADRYLAGIETDIQRGDWQDPRAGTETLRAYALRWVRTRKVKGKPLAPRTTALYEWQLSKHILPTLGKMQLRQIDTATVRRWYDQVADDDTGPGALTAAKCYRLLRAIFNTAVRDGEVRQTPCVLIGAGDEHSPARPAVSIDEVIQIADKVPQRWRCFVLLAAFGGLRIGELAALTRNDVELATATVSVRASASYLPGGARHVGPPKSRAGARTVALPDLVIKDLASHLDRYSQPGSDGLLFIGPRGAAVRETTFGTKIWRPTLAALGLSHLHFHDLRGFAATSAAISGATTAELMYRFGHATPDMALRYQRATATRDAAIARDLNEQLSKRARALDAKAKSGKRSSSSPADQDVLPGL